MKTGRAFLFLTGIALLGAIVRFNEMTPDAQASLLDAAAGKAQSLLQSAVVTYHDVKDKMAAAAAQERPARNPTPLHAAEGLEGGEALPQRTTARTVDAEPPPPAGNPLWALPLKQLAITRERPIFSPARRLPPPPAPTYVAPVAVRQPAKPPEPERPAMSLLGTIIGADDKIGVFLDTATHGVVRLRVGEDHQGWVLRVIRERDATVAKDGAQAVVLELPPPGEAPALGGPTMAPPASSGLTGLAAGTLPILSRTNSADEQPVGSARGTRRQGR
jgi:hypothetical protein